MFKFNRIKNKEKDSISKIKKENEKSKVKTEKIESDKIVNYKFTILAIAAVILFSISLTPVTLQNDTFYTIKIGEHIAQTKTIDMQDPFSWHSGLTYQYPHWLYDLLTYIIYNLCGFTGIFVTTMILSAILGVLLYITNFQISKNRLVSFLLSLGTMYLMKDYITARAQLVSFVLFELEILFIEKFLETKKIRYPILLFLIGVLLANIHSAVWPFFFVLFLPYIAEYICSFNYIKAFYYVKGKYYKLRINYINKKGQEDKLNLIKDKEKLSEENKIIKLNKSEERRKDPYKIRIVKESAVKWLILIMIICAFSGLLTPIGDMPYTYTYKIMQGNTTNSINEHLPLTLINNKPIMIILAAFILILAFTDTKIRLKDLFMLAGLVLLMFMTRRQVSMFLIFCSAVFAKLIADLFAKYDKDGTMEFQRIMVSTLGTVATMLVIALFMILEIKGKVNDKFVSESSYPVKASEYIKENIDISSMKLFNEYNYGSYLLFQGIPVFIDSRCDLYTPQFNKTEEYPDGRDIFSDYINTSNISRYYEKTFDEYGITHIILYKNSKLSMLLSKDPEHYLELYKDSNFVIYQRMID